MTATTVFVRGEPASEAVGLVVGSILLLFGLAQIFMVIRHWHWMQKSRWWKGAWRLRPGSRGIPMGRLGHSYVGTTWVIVGTFVIAGSQKNLAHRHERLHRHRLRVVVDCWRRSLSSRLLPSSRQTGRIGLSVKSTKRDAIWQRSSRCVAGMKSRRYGKNVIQSFSWPNRA